LSNAAKTNLNSARKFQKPMREIKRLASDSNT